MAPLTLAKLIYIKANQNELDIYGGGGISSSRINDKIENLSSSTKVKNSPKIDIFISGVKEVFSYLWKTFSKALIRRHFNLEWNIQIKTDASKYAVSRVFSLITSDQHSFDHVTYKDLNSEIAG